MAVSIIKRSFNLLFICVALLIFSSHVYAQKKGVAGNVENANKVGATWCYNWGSGTPNNLPAGVEFVPMWWGYYGSTQDQDTAGAIALKNAGASYLLTYNEPDHTDQSNLSVSYALQGFKQAGIACTTAGLGCISPAAADDYDSWMVQFMQGVSSQGLRCDSVAIHCYLRDPYAFLNYVDGIHSSYGKPVWITEFAPTDWTSPTTVSIPEVINFIRVAIPGLESRSYVQRYSWYCGTVPGNYVLGTAALFNSDGSVTAAGLAYQNPATTNVIRVGAYKLQNRANGKCLDNLGVITDGATVGQWDSGWSYNQRWRVTYSGGYFRFQCVTGDKFLDTLGNSADGSPIGQKDDNSSLNQQWSIVPTDSGYCQIVNRANGKCLDTGGQNNNGDGMQNWTSGSSYNQQWQFVTTEAPPNTTIALSGTKGNGQWYTSNVTVTLNAAVYSQPITGTYYTLDGGAQQTYTAPFIVSGDGAHTITYWSNDTDNNLEPSHTTTFSIDTTAPSITSLSPASTPVSTAITLTVNGANFTSGSIVKWNDTSLTTTFVSSSKLTADVPVSLNSALSSYPGSAAIKIVNPSGETSNTVSLTITAPVPVITSVSPNNVSASTGFTLTVNGNNFLTGSKIQWNGTALNTTYVSAHTLTAIITKSMNPNLSSYPGSIPVVVNSGGSLSSPVNVTVNASVIHTYNMGIQMISAPCDYSGQSIASICDNPGLSLIAWDASTLTYIHAPNAPADTFRSGKGYWACITAAINLRDTGVHANASTPFTIALSSGWNMIGSPRETSKALYSVNIKDKNGVSYNMGNAISKHLIYGVLFTFPAGGANYTAVSASTGSLAPYAGYWIYAYQPCTLVL